MAKSSANKYIFSIGRRRSSVATVKFFTGKDESTVNKISLSKYFSGALNEINYKKPFEITGTEGKYYFQATIHGGGKNGQLDALVLAIARSLKKIDETKNTPLLRAAGLLTVDSRVRQRRNVGTGGKARRQKQSPKR